MANFQMAASSVTGRDHLLRQANRQDSFACREVELDGHCYLIGVVSDGCGSGAQSEVGAVLTANFVANEAVRLLAQNEFSLPRLYTATVLFLSNIAGVVCGEDCHLTSRFVQQNLLATVLGFVINEAASDCTIFAAGDGLIAINDEIYERDESNRPSYPAYHLLGQYNQVDRQTLPQSFDLVAQLPLGDLARLAICSDGFEAGLLPELWSLTDQPRALQRQCNVWSRQKHFNDDATCVLVESRRSKVSSYQVSANQSKI